MSLEDRNKAVIRRLLEEVVNTGDTAPLAELIDPGCVATDGSTRVPCGVEGMIEHVRGVRATYPDLHLTIERQIAEGEWVATVFTARGTHQGSWLGMAPTGKPVVFSGVNVDRVVEGRLVEHGGAMNTFEGLLAIGAIQLVQAPA